METTQKKKIYKNNYNNVIYKAHRWKSVRRIVDTTEKVYIAKVYVDTTGRVYVALSMTLLQYWRAYYLMMMIIAPNCRARKGKKEMGR